jgi:prepilin-type processing-associated H-X9-DG protein
MQCRCAICSRARVDGAFAPATLGIEIVQATPIGHYGLNIAFSDGHARGIFPFTYLAELAAFEALPGEAPVKPSGTVG